MATRAKEDEKNERIIRNLLKLPENRRCINCNSLGPQYVCTNFWTFVCTTCSGIHREFTHRVKSISMAKFTSQEVSALQGGGNARAKETYFKDLDPQRHSFPDSSNVERLRDFIKHVYVDRRYTGERSFEKPPRVKMGEGDDNYENKRNDTYQRGSRSLPSDYTYEHRYSDKPSPGGRSDDQESRQYGDFMRSPARAEVVNDWRREDRFGNGRRSEDSRMSDGSSMVEGKSPERSPPMVRPVRDILGENVSPLRVIEPPKVNGGRAADVSVYTQRTASSGSLASSNGNPMEHKNENLGSLIDFDAVTQPPVMAAVPQTEQTATDKSIAQPTSSNTDNWASFDSAPNVKVSQVPPNANSLESVLFQLSVPASTPSHSAQTPGGSGIMTAVPGGNMPVLPPSSNSLGAPPGQVSASTNLTGFPPVGAPVAARVGQMSVSPFGVGLPAGGTANNFAPFPAGAPLAAVPASSSVLQSNSVNSFANVADGGQWSAMFPQQHSLFPASGSQPTAQPSFPPVSGSSSSQTWGFSVFPNTLAPSNMPAAQNPTSGSAPASGAISAAMVQSSSTAAKPTLRTELPADFFSVTYPSPMVAPGWQITPHQAVAFHMQYNTVMPMPTFPQSSKSTNPFDLGNDISPAQASTFPSMASLQGALPNVAASSGLLRTSSLGAPATWLPSQSSYPSVPPAQAASFVSAMPPSAYVGQQLYNNLPLRPQAVMGFGSQGPAFGSANPSQQHQQIGEVYSAPATPNAFSAVGGNPFG